MARKSYKYRIYPNQEQKDKLSMFFGCSRKMYNLLLDWWINAYKDWKLNNVPMGPMPQPTYFKNQEEFSYLKNCDSVALATARINLQKAFDNYFNYKKGKRKGKKVGFPQFKKLRTAKHAYGTYNNSDCIKIADGFISIPKIGKVKINLHRPCEGRIKSVVISQTKSGNYYVALTCEVDNTEKCNHIDHLDNLKVVGLDMSLSQFVVSSNPDDNMKTKYVRRYRNNQKRLRKLQRKISRRKLEPTGETVFSPRWNKEIPIKQPSKNREKAQMTYNKLSEHIANQRKDFCIKQALYYARNYDVIVLEDLNMQEMSRALHLGKSVNDLGFGEFKQWLAYKCEQYDSVILFADKWYASSKTCNACGSKYTALRLSDRQWVCPECGIIHDRDMNAAKNLRDFFYKIYNTAGTAEIQACGDSTSTLREILMQVESLNQEAPSFRWG